MTKKITMISQNLLTYISL